MEITKQLITPEIAKKYLEKNSFNRNIKPEKVKQYAMDMLSGRWKEDTFETIKISKNGNVLDAQHRLLAVIMSNKSIWFHVVTGMEESVFDVLDTGAVRNPRDTFKIKGVLNSSTTPNVIAFYNVLKSERPSMKRIIATNAVLLEQYFLDKDKWDKISKNAGKLSISFSGVLCKSHIGGFLGVLYEINEKKACQFMEQLCTGIDIENKSVALLRNKLIADRLSTKKMSLSFKMAHIIKTWNFFISNKEVARLGFAKDEEYPKISKF